MHAQILLHIWTEDIQVCNIGNRTRNVKFMYNSHAFSSLQTTNTLMLYAYTYISSIQ